MVQNERINGPFNILWKLYQEYLRASWFSNILSCTEKNLVLKLWPNIFSANDILVFFNHQYFSNRLIFDFDFLNENRHE